MANKALFQSSVQTAVGGSKPTQLQRVNDIDLEEKELEERDPERAAKNYKAQHPRLEIGDNADLEVVKEESPFNNEQVHEELDQVM
mmetsp:Transcript_5129/g.7843  ORF Transcript_5129/g.7843 Transcript_5129/m.7843 type:complete len:86 (+) Transcript_5129:1920-2177(+)